MEVSQALEFKNASLTTDLMKHFSSFDIKENCPPNNAKIEHYQSNANGDTCSRPVRGTRSNLPKSATNILKDWLLSNWYKPYPTEEEKYGLVNVTGLKMGQVNNWMINARRRLLPGICRKYGLDHSKCKIAKRGGYKGDVTFNIVLQNPDSPERPNTLGYLTDVMLVDEELEKHPNEEGLSRLEVLHKRGLGQFYPCSP